MNSFRQTNKMTKFIYEKKVEKKWEAEEDNNNTEIRDKREEPENHFKDSDGVETDRRQTLRFVVLDKKKKNR